MVVRSFERSRLAEVRRTERADGSGDLVFSQEPVNSGGSERRQDVGFVGVRNVKAVEDAVRGLASEAP